MPLRCSRTTLGGRPAVAPLERRHQRRVLLVGSREHRERMRDVGDQLAHLALNFGHRRHQPRGPRRLGDPEVEEDVRAAVDREVGLAAHRLDLDAQRLEVFGAGALGGEHGRADLDRDAVVEQLAPVAVAELDAAALGERGRLGHERPAAAAALRHQVAALRQRHQRLPQRRARDAELVGELALGRQAVTGPEQAEPDRRAQALDRLLEGRRRLDRLENRRNSRGGDLHRRGTLAPRWRFRQASARCDRRRPARA